MNKIGNLSIPIKTSHQGNGSYAVSYARPRDANSSIIKKITFKISTRNMLSVTITHNNISPEKWEQLIAFPWSLLFQESEVKNQSSTKSTLESYFPIPIKDMPTAYIDQLLSRITAIERIEHNTLLSIFRELSHHTDKIAVTDDMVKTGELSGSLELPISEHYRPVITPLISLPNEQLRSITFLIEKNVFFAKITTALMPTVIPTQLPPTNQSNPTTVIPPLTSFHWSQSLDKLNENPKLIRDLIDYVTSKFGICAATKRLMLQGFSHHIKNLIIDNRQDKEKERADVVLKSSHKSMHFAHVPVKKIPKAEKVMPELEEFDAISAKDDKAPTPKKRRLA